MGFRQKIVDWLFSEPNYKCDCGDPGCKRQIRSTRGGRIYVVNHFTCGKVKKIIRDMNKIKFK